MSELTGKQIGPYQVLELIGRGGMAAVYRAHNTSSDEFVALKLVAPHLSNDPNFKMRFQREAEVLRKLQHPQIIPVLDYGEAGGYAFLVMPFLQVGTLTDRLRAGALGPQEGARLLQQVSDALQYAHDHGVIHRDVKPSNVLLDERGNALLSDFGLARLREASVSVTGSMLVGTPAYISPEQARGEKATARSDQYSLGVILFELTTGQLPFEAETPIAVALKHINEPLPAARAASPNVPELVERVILKATAKNPLHRFPSVAAMNLTFQDALKHSLDPSASPAPAIDLPAPVQSTLALPRDEGESGRLRRNLTRVAGLALAFFLVLPAFTLARVMGFAPGMENGLGELNPVQMAQLNGTLQAMSTELAGSQADLMRAEQVQTAVAATLIAADEEGTPTAVDHPSATPTAEDPDPTLPTIMQLTPISTAVGSASATPEPSALPLGYPSATPSPTATPSTTPEPSPSATAEPSSTPMPTNTPPPTPTEDLCSSISLSGFDVSGKKVSWLAVNGASEAQLITRVDLDWPASNAELRKFRLNNALIWNDGDSDPPTTVQSNWKGTPELPAGSEAVLSFEFANDAAASGYDLQIELEGACQLGAGG